MGNVNAVRRWARLAVIAGVLLSLFACSRQEFLPGTVATVNGKPISFQEMEAVRGNLFGRLAPSSAPPSDAELESQYSRALQQIIVQELVAQQLEKKRMRPSPEALQEQEALIIADYPAGAFEDILLQEGLTVDIWRGMLSRRLDVEFFMSQVLRPEVRISPDEVQAYYNAHKEDFLLPEQWHYVQISGLDKTKVEAARAAVLAGQNAATVQKEYSITLREVRMGADRLPEDVKAALAPLQPEKNSPVQKQGQEFRTFILRGKKEAAMLDAPEIYRRVEQVLVEEKLQIIFDAWAARQIVRAKIRIASPLIAGEMPEKNGPAAR